MKHIKAIATWVAALSFLYAVFSFYHLSINPHIWAAQSRGMLGFLSSISTLVVVLGFYVDKPEY